MILVTGAAGFIGINTVLSLNQQGIKDLIVVDHFDLEEKSEKLELFQYYKSLSVNDCEALLKDDSTHIDLVIHLGAITDTTCNDSQLLKKLNIDFYSNQRCGFCHRSTDLFKREGVLQHITVKNNAPLPKGVEGYPHFVSKTTGKSHTGAPSSVEALINRLS